MHLIDAAGHVGNQFVHEDPATNRPPTEIDAAWLNAVQNELASAINGFGLELDKGTHAQLFTAISRAIDEATKAAAAMVTTYTVVPAVYKAWMIAVTQPHMRVMTWNGTKYVRAPWHQPGMVLYSYDNPASISGYLPVRADVVYQQADYPDLVTRLGLAGAGTFSLIEARGEFLRVLDNGRGVDVGRVLRSAQGDAIRNITGRIAANAGAAYQFLGEGPFSEVSGALDVETRTASAIADATTAPSAGAALIFNASKSGIPTTDPITGENRPRSIALPAWVSY